MKNYVYSFGLASLMISCGAPAEDSNSETKKDTVVQTVQVEKTKIENSFFIESGIVGVFKIGQPFPELPEGLKSRKSSEDIEMNGVKENHVVHVVYNSLEDVAEIAMEKNDALDEEDLSVIKMKVISNYYETKDNLKVGTLLNTVLEKHPDTKIWYDGKTGQILAEAPALISVRFVIDPTSCTKKPSGSKDIKLNKSNFVAEAKVSMIWVL